MSLPAAAVLACSAADSTPSVTRCTTGHLSAPSRDVMGDHEQRDARHRSAPAPRLWHVVGPAPVMAAPTRATPASTKAALTADTLNMGLSRLGASPSLSQAKSRSPPTPNGSPGGHRRRPGMSRVPSRPWS
jgi:hypothetical protein